MDQPLAAPVLREENFARPCAAMIPGHRHCAHGHVGDCPDPGDCPLLDDVQVVPYAP